MMRDDRKRVNRLKLSHRAAKVRCGQLAAATVISNPSHWRTRLPIAGSAVCSYVARMQDVRVFID